MLVNVLLEDVARGCTLRCAMLSPTVQVQNYQVKDIFPYSIAIPLDELKDKSHQEVMLFPKGSSIPSYKMVPNYGRTPFYFQVSYTNMTEFPTGISPIVGHFGIGSFETAGVEKVKVELNVKINYHGIVEIESASLLEDKHFTRRTFQSFLENWGGSSHTSSLEFSQNLDVAATEDELREAKEREQMLSEQDKKVEEIKDLRNTLESFVYETRSKLSSAYRSFAKDTEKKVITDRLQETEDWLYEDSDDESEQNYTGKLNDLKKLLDPVEKRFKDEKAKSEATKALLTRIEEYRSAADSMPSIQKKEVNNECIRAEEWLHRVQHHSSTKNADPIEWSNIIKHGMEFFEWNCKNIMKPKPSFLKHEKPMHSNQRDRSVNSNQMDRTVDSNQRDRTVDPNQRDRTVHLNHRNQRVDFNQRGRTVDWNQRVDLNQRDRSGDSNQRDRSMDLNHRNQRVDSNHRNQHVDSIYRNQRVDSNQYLESIQRDRSRNSNQTGQPVDYPQRHQPSDSDQRDQQGDSDQRGQSEDSDQKDQPDDMQLA